MELDRQCGLHFELCHLRKFIKQSVGSDLWMAGDAMPSDARSHFHSDASSKTTADKPLIITFVDLKVYFLFFSKVIFVSLIFIDVAGIFLLCSGSVIYCLNWAGV